MNNTDNSLHKFQQTVWKYFHSNGRKLPWRPPLLKLRDNGTLDSYAVLVSELMLQQTQVARVVPKFQEFIARFPTLNSLAKASLGEVLVAWSGLGYNRRAQYLHKAAQSLSRVAPWKYEELVKIRGIGPNTAGAILVYAYNKPTAFIETNIRTVFIHHFFADQKDVSDKEILTLVARTLPSRKEQPREWYWALMDYGTYLKTTVGNVAKNSKAYNRQSVFQGSLRQIRGQVIRLLVTQSRNEQDLDLLIPDPRLREVLDNLVKEGLLTCKQSTYRLA